MSSNWKTVTLESVCLKITDGSHFSPKGIKENGFPMYSVKDMNDFGFEDVGVKQIAAEDHERLVQQGCKPQINDVLIAKDGSVLKHIFKVENEINATVLSSIAIIRPDLSKIDPDFLVFALKNPLVYDNILNNYVSGSGVPRIVLKDFKKVTFKAPDTVEEQSAISLKLKSLNSKIHLNIRINKILEEISQNLYKSWFVNFHPVRAKVAAKRNGEDPQLAAMITLSGKSLEQIRQLSKEEFQKLAEVANIFPDELEVTKEGEIPKGWQWSTIGKEVDVKGGGTPSTKVKEYWHKGENHWVTPKDLSPLTDKILTTTERKITTLGVRQVSSGILPVNTVLLSSRAPVGYLAISKIPVSINQGFIAMVCTGQLTPEYIIQWAQQSMPEIIQRASGTTFLEISKKNFTSINVIIPHKNVLNRYTEHVKANYDLMTNNILSNLKLANMRDMLQPILFAGPLLQSSNG